MGYKDTALRGLLHIIQEYVPVLVAAGVTVAEAEHWLRWAFIDRLARDEQRQGRTANASHLELVTGIKRRYIHEILDAPPNIDSKAEPHPQINQILTAWHTQPLYSTPEGPRSLLIDESSDEKGFRDLVRSCTDISPPLMLREFMRIGVIEKLPDRRVRPLMRTYPHARFTSDAIQEVGFRGRDLLSTLVAYVLKEKPHHARAYTNVQTFQLAPESAPIVRKRLEELSADFADKAHQLLHTRKWAYREGQLGPPVWMSWTCYCAERPVTELSEFSK
jgi:hypothetical protein